MQLNWTIIGCGWLGVTLAEELIRNGKTVFGSTTTEAKLPMLNEMGINAFVLRENATVPVKIVESTDIVVLSVPPIKKEEPSAYGNYLCSITDQFKPETRFIFLGSTGIYPQKTGVYTEDYVSKSDEKSTVLYQAEEQLKRHLGSRLTRLRLGGLIGNNRHPVHSLSGKVNVKNPKGVINFVDKRDVIQVVLKVSETDTFGQVFNVVYPLHPTREKYYAELADKLGIPTPNFDSAPSIIREISSTKLMTSLGFIFEHSIQ